MANRDRREALRGAEEETFDLLAETLPSEQWVELLKAVLERAVLHGNRDIAQKLVEVNRDRRLALRGSDRCEALRGAEEETFDLLAEALTSVRWAEILKAPLVLAALHGNRGLAQKLVGAGAEVGDALHAAARGGHGDVVNDLLENGAFIDAKHTSRHGCTPLHVAARSGDTEMVQLLLLKGANKDALDNEGSTPLSTGALCGHKGAALALLAAGADVNVRCRAMSIVHIVAEQGNVETLNAVVARGADVTAVDIGQETALHHAARKDKAEVIDVLVQAGANIEARDVDGCTPLHFAANELSLEALPALLKLGAHVNAQDQDRDTPLHWAAVVAGRQGAAEVVDLLLRSGADETILDDEGQAAVDVVADDVEEEGQLAEDVDRVRELLAKAPADRAWRRRGYLVLCRAHPNRVLSAQDASSACADVARGRRKNSELGRTETDSCTGTAGGAGGDWAVVLARVLGLQEEGIFRSIVGYL